MRWPWPPAWPAWRSAWQWLSRGRLRLAGAAAAALFLVFLVALAVYSSVALARFERVEERRATFVYAAWPMIA